MKVIFSDKSRICIDEGDDSLLGVIQIKMTARKNSTTSKLLMSFPIWYCMSFKGSGQMGIIASTLNAHIYIKNRDNNLVPSIDILSLGTRYDWFSLGKAYKMMIWPAISKWKFLVKLLKKLFRRRFYPHKKIYLLPFWKVGNISMKKIVLN